MKSQNLKIQTDRALDSYLPPADREPKTLHRAMRYSVFSGGKRIRPIIVLAAAGACGLPARKALPAACAVELVHTYSLIHDDLPAMDDDDYRRGKPACHRKFGEAGAILAGDALLTLAFNIIARKMPPSVSVQAAKELSEAAGTFGMVGGQTADIELHGRNNGFQALERINRMKTARLFEASARLGAVAARADSRKTKAMADYGGCLGMAFQAVDDILDGDGCVKFLGKRGSRAYAEEMIKRAKAALKPFGSGAGKLMAIADQVLDRIR
jgi:geranylgeranyl diphosphate synthase type II